MDLSNDQGSSVLFFIGECRLFPRHTISDFMNGMLVCYHDEYTVCTSKVKYRSVIISVLVIPVDRSLTSQVLSGKPAGVNQSKKRKSVLQCGSDTMLSYVLTLLELSCVVNYSSCSSVITVGYPY